MFTRTKEVIPKKDGLTAVFFDYRGYVLISSSNYSIKFCVFTHNLLKKYNSFFYIYSFSKICNMFKNR